MLRTQLIKYRQEFPDASYRKIVAVLAIKHNKKTLQVST